MMQRQLHSTCDDCISLVQHTATILQSSDQDSVETPYNSQYQTRLLANVASSNCHMCTILHAYIPRLIAPFEPGEEMRLSTRRAPNDPLVVRIYLCGSHEKTGMHCFYPGRLRVHQAGHVNVQTLNSSKTWSLESLHSIKSWLRNCTSYHDKCLNPKESQRLPLRLIDVDTTGTTQVPSSDKMEQEDFDRLRVRNSNGIHIVSTKPLSPDTQYLTLSHRWGSQPSIELSRKTSFLLTEDISPHLLKYAEATLFQHAIHVTRSLGFRYMWIDALCIMQDDEMEKKAEIMRMDDIYLNAELNISAAEADPLRGLIFDRKALVVNPCLTKTRIPGTKEHMSLCVVGEDITTASWWAKPLDTRGWVCQERILSRRIIRFTKDQVLWECWSLTASEVLPEGLLEQKHSSSSGYRPVGLISDKSIGIDPTRTDIQQIKLRWYNLVDNYSRTSLSFSDDRLLAISGVAKRFSTAMRVKPSNYLAGMWKDDLPLSLVWIQDRIPGRSGPAEARDDLEMKYAPSWSWASVMVPVRTIGLFNSTLNTTAEVVDIEVQPRSCNPYDGTKLCRLRLRGPLCRFRRHLLDGLPWIQVSERNDFREAECYDLQTEGRIIFMYWDTARRLTADEYFLLLISSSVEVIDREPQERGLILLRTAQNGTYRRAGSFQISLWSEYPGSRLNDALNGDFHTLRKEDYIELDSDGRCIIDII